MPPLHKLQHSEQGYFCALSKYENITKDYETPIKTAYEMLVWLLENDFIKKESYENPK